MKKKLKVVSKKKEKVYLVWWEPGVRDLLNWDVTGQGFAGQQGTATGGVSLDITVLG